MAKVSIPNPNKSTRKGQCHDEAVENDIIGTEGLRETAKMFEAIKSLPLLLEKSEKEFQQMQETITQLEQKLSDKQEQVKMMTKTMENDRFLLEQNLKEKQDLVKDKEKIETELINCKGRLSRYLGNKLTENNPGITDLSNENRPNKLGERFSELYDNQWTDAFEDLDKSNPNNEQANVEILLEILMDANTMCKEVSEKQHMDLRKMAYLKPVMEVETPKTPNDGSKVKDREDCKESENRDVKEAGSLETVLELNKQVKEFRRYTASLALGAVQGMYTERMKHKGMIEYLNKYNSERLTSYIKECVEICWLMNVQEPPVVLAPMPEVLSQVNLDLYRHYMRSGACVEFLVWPAMLLHEGGPTIMKGVVQGCPAGSVIPPKNIASIKATNEKDEGAEKLCKDRTTVRGMTTYLDDRKMGLGDVNDQSTGQRKPQLENINPVDGDVKTEFTVQEESVNNDLSEDTKIERTEDEMGEASFLGRSHHNTKLKTSKADKDIQQESDATNDLQRQNKEKKGIVQLPQINVGGGMVSANNNDAKGNGHCMGKLSDEKIPVLKLGVDAAEVRIELPEESDITSELKRKKKSKKQRKRSRQRQAHNENSTTGECFEHGLGDAPLRDSAQPFVKLDTTATDAENVPKVSDVANEPNNTKTKTTYKKDTLLGDSSPGPSAQPEEHVNPEVRARNVESGNTDGLDVKNKTNNRRKKNDQQMKNVECKAVDAATAIGSSTQGQTNACGGISTKTCALGDNIKDKATTTNTGKGKKNKNASGKQLENK